MARAAAGEGGAVRAACLEAAAAHAEGHAVHEDLAVWQRGEGGAGPGGLSVLALAAEGLVGAGVGVDGGGDGNGAAAALADVGSEGGEAGVRVDRLVGDVNGPAWTGRGLVENGLAAPARVACSTGIKLSRPLQ